MTAKFFHRSELADQTFDRELWAKMLRLDGGSRDLNGEQFLCRQLLGSGGFVYDYFSSIERSALKPFSET